MDTDRKRERTVSDPWHRSRRSQNRVAGSGEAGQERDDHLVARVAAGGAGAGEALAELFDRHSGRVLGLVERVLGPGGEAEEVLQDVFVQLWRQARRYRSPRNDGKAVRGWLLVLARSRALDRLRSASARRRREERLWREAGPRTVAPVGSERLEREEHRRQLTAALGRLPAEQRRAIELAYFDGLSCTQIAARLEAPLGTVKSRLLLGMRRLRRLLPAAADGRAAWAAA